MSLDVMDKAIEQELRELEAAYSATDDMLAQRRSILQEMSKKYNEIKPEYDDIKNKYDDAKLKHDYALHALSEAVDIHTDAFQELDRFRARHNLY